MKKIYVFFLIFAINAVLLYAEHQLYIRNREVRYGYFSRDDNAFVRAEVLSRCLALPVKVEPGTMEKAKC
ncbi:MAG: hypothetical protein J7M18_01670 [Candidatus Eremiobacteraeota bacterium]|nr:hypothetical protein [Candidatus Eremiobacteraeota bacterium]